MGKDTTRRNRGDPSLCYCDMDTRGSELYRLFVAFIGTIDEDITTKRCV